MSERQYNEEKYNNLKVEGDDIKNAAICDEIADNSYTWNPGEAAYWRKKAIEKMENYYGKDNIANTFYYDKIVNDFLAKNSYKQAEKWNQKSKKIKKLEKGEYAFDIITNEINELQIDISLGKYDEVAECMEHVKESLQRNSDRDPVTLHHIYLDLSFIEGNSDVRKVRANDGYFIDHAIELAQKIYGEDSLEVAEAYRKKANGIAYMCRGEVENEKALELFKKALTMAKKRGSDGSALVQRTFDGMALCWDGEVRWQESIKWTYRHISTEAVVDIMGIYPEHIRKEMREALATIADQKDREVLDKAYNFYQMLEQGQVNFADWQEGFK